MSDLRVFYRILGIARHIVDPSYYHILGIDRKGCNADVVRSALKARKRELRENIPGPEFIPLVMKFEKEQLEVAAEVLADEHKRREYDKQLLLKQRQIEKKTEENAALLERTRAAVMNAVSSDGTLTPARRVALAKELRQIGVAQKNVDAILARIPLSNKEETQIGLNVSFFRDAVSLEASDGPLSPEQFNKLVKLGKRLGLTEKAVFECIEEVSGDHVLEPVERQTKGDPSHATVSHLSETDIDSLLDLSEDGGATAGDELVDIPLDPVTEEETEDQIDRDRTSLFEGFTIDWAAVVNFAVPVLCTLILIGVIAFLSSNRGDQEVEEDLPPDVRSEQPEPDQPVQVPDENDALDVPEQPRPPENAVQTTFQAQPIVPQKDVPPPSEDYAFLKSGSGYGLDRKAAMADIGMAMMVCAQKAYDFCDLPYDPNVPKFPLNEDWAELVEQRITLDLDSDDENTRRVTAEELEELQGQMAASDRVERYKAIERLETIGSSKAVDILFGADKQGFSGDRKTINARLRAVKRIGGRDNAIRLANAISQTDNPLISHQVWIALMDMTGIGPADPGHLKPRNTETERRQCSDWWLNAVREMQFTDPDQTQYQQGRPAAAEYVDAGKYFAFGARSCGIIGRLCEMKMAKQSNETRQGDDEFDVPNEFSQVGEEALAQAGYMTDQIGILVRQHIRADVFRDAIASIELQRQARRSCCHTYLQKFAVELDSSVRLLEVLTLQIDERGEYVNALDKLTMDHRTQLQNCTNIIDEIRVNAIANLQTWELINTIREEQA
ncbi:hypothetical protein STSP2_02692 [Anaerohalosphaera lusitana]|uniref:J domain-containing protein n=1 Tax=Anaerohalosphaera lusitana TaxID=1936003 RepID=A0A1U9NNK4_9BACT|nr:hypothetical protein [Anaerohalosphaera lusitana]AQT69501.1 hypothetical protein STSP2_02692 [Anaerohalosphaera lusitana]